MARRHFGSTILDFQQEKCNLPYNTDASLSTNQKACFSNTIHWSKPLVDGRHVIPAVHPCLNLSEIGKFVVSWSASVFASVCSDREALIKKKYLKNSTRRTFLFFHPKKIFLSVVFWARGSNCLIQLQSINKLQGHQQELFTVQAWRKSCN